MSGRVGQTSFARVWAGAAATLATVGWLGAGAANAAPLPDAIYQSSVQGFERVFGPGTNSYDIGLPGITRLASATTTTEPRITLSADAYDGGFTSGLATARATIEYYFRISGAADAIVPISFTYRFGFGAGPQVFNVYGPDDYYHTGYYGAVSVNIDGSDGSSGYHYQRQDVGGVPCIYSSLAGPTCADGPRSEDVTQVVLIDAVANTNYRVVLHSEIGDPDWGHVYSFVDPFIDIAPDFRDDFALELSSGIGNIRPDSGGVPEPSTWLLSIAGFGAVGAASRRRRRAPA